MATLSLEAYEAERLSLRDQDKSLRRENLTKHLRSEAEIEADKIVRNIRTLEAETVWKAEYPSIPHPFPGMEFLTGKSIIVQTKLFEILSKMPKGGLLHAHLDATVNVSILLQLALKYPAIHVRVPHAITANNLGSTLPEFSPLPVESYTNAPGLTGESYVPETWVPLQNARSSFPVELGGEEGFDKWVVAALMINPGEAYGTHNTVSKIWGKFASTFAVVRGLVLYKPVWRDYIREFLYSSVADGISYVEPRITFLNKFMFSEEGREDVPHREWVAVFDEVLKEVKEDLARQGRENEFIGAKIIYSTIRHITPEELVWYMEDCITLKQEFPHLITGFDLVGPEDTMRPLKYYLKELLWFKERQKEAGVDIPYVFHAGETFGDGNEADENLYDAILLGTKRIGHGFSMAKHPKLLEICREKGIALEVCPISNEILRLTSSMPMHPLPIVMNNGVPVALCSDDPAVFGNMGLTFDFYQVLVASEVNGLSTLGAIARDSIEFSLLEPEQKERALSDLGVRWEGFNKYVVDVYTCL